MTCVVAAQMVLCEALIEILGAIVVAEKESVIVLLAAVVGLAHDALLVRTQCTASPDVGEVSVNELELVPTASPFLNHWYDGFVPPLVSVAVYTTCVVAAQIVDCEAVMEIPGATVVVENESVIVLLVAMVGLAHEALLVKTQ